jgi:hypothetical protein
MQRQPAEGGITIITFTDGRAAEIIINSENVPDAMGLVRELLAHDVTAAKIIKEVSAKAEKSARRRRLATNRRRAKSHQHKRIHHD